MDGWKEHISECRWMEQRFSRNLKHGRRMAGSPVKEYAYLWKWIMNFKYLFILLLTMLSPLTYPKSKKQRDQEEGYVILWDSFRKCYWSEALVTLNLAGLHTQRVSVECHGTTPNRYTWHWHWLANTEGLCLCYKWCQGDVTYGVLIL